MLDEAVVELAVQPLLGHAVDVCPRAALARSQASTVVFDPTVRADGADDERAGCGALLVPRLHFSPGDLVLHQPKQLDIDHWTPLRRPSATRRSGGGPDRVVHLPDQSSVGHPVLDRGMIERASARAAQASMDELVADGVEGSAFQQAFRRCFPMAQDLGDRNQNRPATARCGLFALFENSAGPSIHTLRAPRRGATCPPALRRLLPAAAARVVREVLRVDGRGVGINRQVDHVRELIPGPFHGEEMQLPPVLLKLVVDAHEPEDVGPARGIEASSESGWIVDLDPAGVASVSRIVAAEVKQVLELAAAEGCAAPALPPPPTRINFAPPPIHLRHLLIVRGDLPIFALRALPGVTDSSRQLVA
jgi:hypothetical protein